MMKFPKFYYFLDSYFNISWDFSGFFEKKLPDGREVRLSLAGTFKGFIDQ
ncbi:hypothetical protein ACEOWJ_001764 [Bacillus cereus]